MAESAKFSDMATLIASAGLNGKTAFCNALEAITLGQLTPNYKPSYGNWQGEGCPICLDDYTEGQQVAVLPCGHILDASCLVGMLTTMQCRHCPSCRSDVFSEELDVAIREERDRESFASESNLRIGYFSEGSMPGPEWLEASRRILQREQRELRERLNAWAGTQPHGPNRARVEHLSDEQLGLGLEAYTLESLENAVRYMTMAGGPSPDREDPLFHAAERAVKEACVPTISEVATFMRVSDYWQQFHLPAVRNALTAGHRREPAWAMFYRSSRVSLLAIAHRRRVAEELARTEGPQGELD